MPSISSNINVSYEKAVAVDYYIEEENYINDIPFNTFSVSAEYNYLESMEEDFEIEEESYIDDIPFNTKRIIRLNNSF